MRTTSALLLASLALAACATETSTQDSGGRDAGAASDSGAPVDAASIGSDAPGSDAASSGDPYTAARQACLDAINTLRAGAGSPAYTLWAEANTCTDGAAAFDAANGAHASYGMCGENGQNECMGFGPENIADCVRLMWSERDQPSCAGCDACLDTPDMSCPNCDFFGRSSPLPCGHYVNLAARYHTQVSCGFLPPSFATMNFH